jgi:putative membrane protein
MMLAQAASYAAYGPTDAGWRHGPWDGGGPGWWLVFPILFWVLVLSAVGYGIYRRSPGRAARAAAERVLTERYARGEIGEDELKQRRAVLRSKG